MGLSGGPGGGTQCAAPPVSFWRFRALLAPRRQARIFAPNSGPACRTARPLPKSIPMQTLSSYVLGRWIPGTEKPVTLENPTTEAAVAVVGSGGFDAKS